MTSRPAALAMTTRVVALLRIDRNEVAVAVRAPAGNVAAPQAALAGNVAGPQALALTVLGARPEKEGAGRSVTIGARPHVRARANGEVAAGLIEVLTRPRVVVRGAGPTARASGAARC
ncbi:MAG: hypothetical protein ABI903_17705 [Actinomycetota bacterium]